MLETPPLFFQSILYCFKSSLCCVFISLLALESAISLSIFLQSLSTLKSAEINLGVFSIRRAIASGNSSLCARLLLNNSFPISRFPSKKRIGVADKPITGFEWLYFKNKSIEAPHSSAPAL